MSYRVAVYGTLKKGGHNHRLLNEAKYLGQDTTEAKYNLYSLGCFPAVTINGPKAIEIEVYEVSAAQLVRLNYLEGFVKENSPSNFYNRIEIPTKFGYAYMYTIDNISEYRGTEINEWSYGNQTV